MRNRVRWPLIALAAAASWLAPGEPRADEGASSSAASSLAVDRPPTPITGGEPTEPGEFDGVVGIVTPSGKLCSGTVVAPRLVLTAAHCLAEIAPTAELRVFFGATLGSNAPTIASGRGVHPDYCATCREDIYDYAYVELGADFTVPGGFILPITTQDEWDEAMRPGRELIVVGYGEDPDSQLPDLGIGIKRKVTIPIDRISEAGLEVYARGDHRDSCNGDSGGPAFIRLEDGSMRLLGITSRGSKDCVKGGYYGAPYPALCWVRDETAVDLVGPECADCDCLDTTPYVDPGCCAVDRPRTFDAASLLGLFALAAWRRRSRRRVRSRQGLSAGRRAPGTSRGRR